MPGGGARVRAAGARRYLAIRAAVVHGVEAASSIILAPLECCAAELVRALRGSTKGLVHAACGSVLCGGGVLGCGAGMHPHVAAAAAAAAELVEAAAAAKPAAATEAARVVSSAVHVRVQVVGAVRSPTRETRPLPAVKRRQKWLASGRPCAMPR